VSSERRAQAARQKRLAAVRARLQRVAETGDLSLAVEPKALTEARRLVATFRHDEQDLEAFHVLGWLYWFRYQALPEGEDQADLSIAVGMLAPCFMAGADDLPEPLLPLLAEAAVPVAVDLRRQIATSTDPDLISATVYVWQRILDVTPADHPDRAVNMFNLGGVLRARFERTGQLADMSAAIDAFRAAAEATPVDNPRWVASTFLGGVLHVSRFERTGDTAVLDTAIDMFRTAAEAAPANGPDHAGMLAYLGNALRVRFDSTGSIADLNAAISALRAAVKGTPGDDPHRAGHLDFLGRALLVRFQRTGTQADLDAAITVGREAVTATPAGHPDRASHLNDLGNTLQVRFQRTGSAADLDAAVGMFREAVDATPADLPYRAIYLTSLGNALKATYERTQHAVDLDAAIDSLRAAVELVPADHHDRLKYLHNLGRALEARFAHTGEEADRGAAVSVYVRAWESDSATPSNRISAAGAAAALLAEPDPGRAAGLLEAAVRLLPEVAPRQLDRDDQQFELGGYAGLAGDAAALALADPRRSERERAARALSLLETGRAVLLSQALDTRSDLTDLQQQHPSLAARFVELRNRLDHPAEANAPTGLSNGSVDTLLSGQDRIGQDRLRLAREFAATLNEIRADEEFSSFGLPPSTDELLTQTDQGPVVVFNVSPYRSDALLLTSDGINAFPLPELRHAALIDRINAFHQALHSAASGTSAVQRREAQATLTQILQWLWDVATGPVLTVLGHHHSHPGSGTWPRVWWAPGGLLGLLPVHAAGYHADPADDPERRTVLDRVVSSYTPTVRALRYSRQQATSAPPESARALVVAMPTTPRLAHHGRLRYVPAEVSMLHKHLPEVVLLREPDPDSDPAEPSVPLPTKSNVLAQLPGCPIAHFACHGANHPADPSKSLLLLHDHDNDPFTVASLAPIRLGRAQLAYLSACRTATIEATRLLDESIHLASAFQLAGFPHVIGTLWEINDQIAATVADAFYAHLKNDQGILDTGRAAYALHHAIRAVRDGLGLPDGLNRIRTASLWAAYLHAGA